MQNHSFFQRLQASLTELSHAQRRRGRRQVRHFSSTHCEIDGQKCVSFSTNDYLGLAQHPRVTEAFSRAAALRAGAGASALVSGRSGHHEELERGLAAFEMTESAILFPSGYAANMGTLTSLIQPRDAVFCDRENHASLIDGCRSGAGKFFVYDRADLDRLQEAMQRRAGDFEMMFIVTDSVFSMDGTVADLPSLCEIAERFGASIVVDEAHATGVFGDQGRGLCEYQDVESRVSVKIGTLSKAIGGLGGFVAGTQVLCDWLWNSARTQFFSTALPPAVCVAALTSLQVIQDEPERRQRLAERAQFARQTFRNQGLTLIFDSRSPPSSPIIAVLVEDNGRAVRVSQKMQERGFLIPAVRPPTVTEGTARLRFSVCCDHSEEEIREAAWQLRDVLESDQP